MTKNRIDHTHCTHPRDAKGRAACRASGAWYALSVNNGHTDECLNEAAYRAVVNQLCEANTPMVTQRLAGLGLIDNDLTPCTCNR